MRGCEGRGVVGRRQGQGQGNLLRRAVQSEARTPSKLNRLPPAPAVCLLSLRSLFLDEVEDDLAALHLFEGDARGLGALRVHLDARARAALELLAALRG